MFRRVLIANRGEIAVRITHTLQEMGIRAIAVYAEPDRHAPHVMGADEAYLLGGSSPAESYLRGDAILEIARGHDVDAIHPGYGFLAENGPFARACAEAGVTFIGPPPEAIEAMGDKIVAKTSAEAAGVPVAPHWSPPEHGEEPPPAEFAARADAIGYPMLVKAAAGGGGKGMRVVEQEADLSAAMDAARREARAAFGDARIFLERYIPRARHVEFQIFGDGHGRVVHLHERECSVQRRHQKIIEEAPAPGLAPELRLRMGEAAVRAAKAIGYVNAGTVEFMVEPDGRFHFLEVNARLQVEHPVTELILGQDLVRAQIQVAAGEPLPFPDTLHPAGHAIECRICAEDAARDFLPCTGTVEVYEPPGGPGVRVDSGITQGSEVTVHYDPLLAKLVAWGDSRETARRRMVAALDRFVILGVTTNIDFLRAVLSHDHFREGRLHTRFLQEQAFAPGDDEPPPEAVVVAALTALSPGAAPPAPVPAGTADPWRTAGPWRMD